MKTIIYLLLAAFIIGMLPLNTVTATDYVRIVIEATDAHTSGKVLKQSSDIMSGRLNDAGIKTFEINIEPGRIIVTLDEQFATKEIQNLLITKGRFEFREADKNRLILEGKDIESMRVGLDSSDKPCAEIQFRKEAVPMWAEATHRNLNKRIAVLLDNRTIYDPVVRGIIPNGSCIITGSFSVEELQFLSILGNNGELPAEFRIEK